MHHAMLHSTYPLIFLILGLLLLFFGRALFWLFVAAAGFLVGVEAAPLILPHGSEMLVLAAAVILGIIGAVLAIFVQKLAVALAGFVAGGYLGAELFAPLLGGAGIKYAGAWLCFVIGGIIGAIVMVAFFNWALIILSSFQGAHLIVRDHSIIRGMPMQYHHVPFLLIILAVIGIVFQASTYRRRTVPET